MLWRWGSVALCGSLRASVVARVITVVKGKKLQDDWIRFRLFWVLSGVYSPIESGILVFRVLAYSSMPTFVFPNTLQNPPGKIRSEKDTLCKLSLLRAEHFVVFVENTLGRLDVDLKTDPCSIRATRG